MKPTTTIKLAQMIPMPSSGVAEFLEPETHPHPEGFEALRLPLFEKNPKFRDIMKPPWLRAAEALHVPSGIAKLKEFLAERAASAEAEKVRGRIR